MRLCSLTSGSSGNCICISSDSTHILVDAGMSGKRMEQGLNAIDLTLKDISGVLVTHEHSDHIKGLGVLARRYEIPIYGSSGTMQAICGMSYLGEIDKDLVHTICHDVKFCIGDMEVEPFRTSHDAAEPVAYRVNYDGKSVGVVTDLGMYDDYTVAHLQGLDGLLLEANHDVNMLLVGNYPYRLKQRILSEKGHLSNESAGRLLCRLLHDKLNTVLLGHLSKENNYERLAYEAVRMEVTMGDVPYQADDFPIRIAHRDEVSECVYV